MKHVFVVAALVALSACGTSPAPNVSDALPAPPGAADNIAFGALLNGVRAQNGARSVRFDSRLARVAQAHADDMNTNGFFRHVGSDNSTIGLRGKRGGYKWRVIGENIAKGQQSESAAMLSWTNSPGHHANNINPDFKHFALAKAGSGYNTYWVLVLGAER